MCMLSYGKDFIMSIVMSMSYCLEAVDEGGHGDHCKLTITSMVAERLDR